MFKHLVLKKLDKLERILNHILEKEIAMSVQLDNLTREVAETKAIEQSAIVLIQGLAARLQEIADDPVAIQALANELDVKAAELAAAIAAVPPLPVPPTP
jgi:hypothetical protein